MVETAMKYFHFHKWSVSGKTKYRDQMLSLKAHLYPYNRSLLSLSWPSPSHCNFTIYIARIPAAAACQLNLSSQKPPLKGERSTLIGNYPKRSCHLSRLSRWTLLWKPNIPSYKPIANGFGKLQNSCSYRNFE